MLGFAFALEGECAGRIAQPNLREEGGYAAERRGGVTTETVVTRSHRRALGFAYASEGECAGRIAQPNLREEGGYAAERRGGVTTETVVTRDQETG